MKTDYRKSKAGKRRFGHPWIYRLTVWIQRGLWKVGIPWHNSFSDECTPDFDCCSAPLPVPDSAGWWKQDIDGIPVEHRANGLVAKVLVIGAPLRVATLAEHEAAYGVKMRPSAAPNAFGQPVEKLRGRWEKIRDLSDGERVAVRGIELRARRACPNTSRVKRNL